MSLADLSRSRKIHELALQHGFALCGVGNRFQPDKLEYLKRWLSEKKFGQMKWFENNQDERLDPSRLLPQARSFIVFGKRQPEVLSSTDNIAPFVARYAFGKDYHRHMKESLGKWVRDFQDWMSETFTYRIFVDTGPLLERDLAAQAGLGWIGKNTLLINRQHGSHFWLGVVITDLELMADEADTDRCGSCRLCVDACPTGALTEYQLNAPLCLSYQTIELRGTRDAQLRREIGAHLVGCDICQDVCPWNHQLGRRDEEAHDAAGLPTLAQCLVMTRGEYQRRFGATAIFRIRYPDFMRGIFLLLARLKKRELLADVVLWKKKHPDLNLVELDYCVRELSS